MTETIKFLKTREVKSPTRANQTDAGIDFYVPEFTPIFIKDLASKNSWMSEFKIMNFIKDKSFVLYPQQRVLIPSGIHCQMAGDHRALIAFNKSGVAANLGLIVGSAVVDTDYQGEIHLSLINTSNMTVTITAGMKIVQFIEMPIINSYISIVEEQTISEFYGKETSRGSKGFGSSDKK